MFASFPGSDTTRLALANSMDNADSRIGLISGVSGLFGGGGVRQ